ncbi:MAG TPA: lipase family protein [Rhodopila sp.]|jgi:pimeloyl-ACP methyl ester carboxylesterase|nr:lipase family protein [Rhodopila sp.]
MRLSLTVLLTIVLSAGTALAARVPAPDPSQGDGGVSPFYTWTGDIPGTPGRLLRSEPLDPADGLAAAGQQFRILYTSTDGIGGETPVAVSGAYFVPRGTPPAGGWPLVAWAHGTTGIADTCAPSWTPRSKRDASYLNTWLEQGYAIVATDYQGLGTPGPHPYLAVRPEAYSVLDSVRAVLKGFPSIANKIVVIGQSQGGQAAFATAGLAARYAPELNIRGTVATGVPFTGGPRPAPASPDSVDPTAAYTLYIAVRMQQAYPSLQPNQLVSARALPLLEQARTTCVGALFRAVQAAGLNRETTIGIGFNTAIKTVLLTMEYATLKLPQPLFVGTGAYDHDVPPARQLALVRNACAEGSVVEAHLYAGLNHGETLNASQKDSVPFVRKILAGEPITSICEPVAQ